MSQGGATALLLTAKAGHKGIVELLLDRGADMEAKDRVSAAAGCVAAPRAALGVTGGPGGAAMTMTRWGVVLVWRAGM